MKKIIFFLGKGGVGKTTSSACISQYLSSKKNNIYWFSIDPAHNIFDVLERSNQKTKQQVNDYLLAEEIDVEFYLKKFIKQTSDKMKDTYRYLQIINLDQMFDIMKYSPGMEESAMMYAMSEKFKGYTDKDYIIVDTPPTGLMLKIFALPFTSLMWIKKLIKLRRKILSRRSAIANINKNRFDDAVSITEEEDNALKELGVQKGVMTFLIDILRDKDKTKMVVVLNEDTLSINESSRIKEALDIMKIPVSLVLINKAGLINRENNSIASIFKNIPIEYVSYDKQGKIDTDHMISTASLWADKIL